MSATRPPSTSRRSTASKELTGDGKLSVSVSGGFNTQTLSSDFMRMDGVNSFGFAGRTQPGTNLDTYNFRNSLDPSKQNLQINQSYTISGGKRFRFGDDALVLPRSVTQQGLHPL